MLKRSKTLENVRKRSKHEKTCENGHKRQKRSKTFENVRKRSKRQKFFPAATEPQTSASAAAAAAAVRLDRGCRRGRGRSFGITYFGTISGDR